MKMFTVLVPVMAICASWGAADAAVTLLGVQYQQDNLFPEFNCIWNDKSYPASCSVNPNPGCNVHVYLKNSGGSPVTVSDVTLAGISLKNAIRADSTGVYSSIYFNPNNSITDLVNAGEPIWYKADPSTIPAGGSAQAVVRLRYVPVTQPVSIDIQTSAGTVSATIPVDANAPQVASVSFSSDLTKVYLHWRRGAGAAPASVYMDGIDLTASTTTVGDPGVNFAASVVQLTQPLSAASYHVFKGLYLDGKTAMAGVRAWANPFLYDSVCAFPTETIDDAKGWITDATNHCMNAVVKQMASSGLADLFGTTSGRQWAADHGYGVVSSDDQRMAWGNPLMWFLFDEPDAHESNDAVNRKLPPGGGHNCGLRTMSCMQIGEDLRRLDPLAPTTINLDAANKPSNYYIYGQTVDVLMVDCYYQRRLTDAYWRDFDLIQLYRQARDYIYAVSRGVTSGAEPNPSHMLLYSCEWQCQNTKVCLSDYYYHILAFPTPESKRMEAYYALAGGVKGLGYWWFKPGYDSNGLGDQDTPEAQAVWKEMGLVGAEIKTIAPLLVTSHPIDMSVQGSTNVWAKALASGTDTMILLVVNDDYYNDIGPADKNSKHRSVCHYTPVSNATVTAALPAWMQSSPTAFEISAGGLSNVNTSLNEGQLQLNLGTLDLTRMIVITTNPQLRAAIQQRYDTEIRDKVCTIAEDVCLGGIAPRITQHPQSATICQSRSLGLTVGVTGTTPFAYQWQKNLVNLADGGHYAGATTNTLTISNTSTADNANYRCVVSNGYGSATSNAATLAVIECNANCLTNLGFENGFVGGAGIGWVKFIKSGSEGTNLGFFDETTEVHGGAHSQRIYSHDNQNDGGVYQQFTATPGQPYTLKAWFKATSPQGTGIAEGLLGVDPYGGTDPDSSNIAWLSKPYDYWSQKPSTVIAQGNYITVYLRGHSTKDPSKNKTANVYIDDIQLAPGAPTDDVVQVYGATAIQWRWLDLSIEANYRVRDVDGTDKSGLLPADTTEWTETIGIVPNTRYTRRIYAINDCGESDGSVGQTVLTLSAPPDDGSMTPSNSTPDINENIVWTAVGEFGPGTLQYYRYAWDQSPTHDWTNQETQWSDGTITTSPAAMGTWYLHVQGYNADNIANGTYDYDVTTGGTTVAADLDRDGDVDLDDFDLLLPCLSAPAAAPALGCGDCDLDTDNDVDQSDFGIFQRCYSGPNVAADPGCAN